MRITKQNLENAFLNYCKQMCWQYGYREGTYSLEYISEYGGYVIEKHIENGGISHPLGMERRSLKDMYNVLIFSLQTIYVRDREVIYEKR
jgi:hypothetical protein